MLPFDRELSKLVAAGTTESEIAEFIAGKGHTQLIDDAIEKMKDGTTSFSEVISIVNLT